jgi:hypothetical protein
MVEIPPYVKLVVNNTMRKDAEPVQKSSGASKLRPASGVKVGDQVSESGGAERNVDTVSLISQENRRAWDTQPPTLQEAEDALANLTQDLPGYDQDLGEIHSHLDRRVILSLLAPLVM